MHATVAHLTQKSHLRLFPLVGRLPPAVPPDVQQLLRLEPHFAPFHFDQVVERLGPSPKGPANPKLLAGPLQSPKGRSPSQH